jgi:putative nucleotidyltransferase with HDIG domain
MHMSSPVAHGRAPDGLRLGRYLPLSLVMTAAVIALPVLAVAQLGPARGPLAVALHVMLAVALSLALARGLALLWSRHEHSSDLVFGDLLLWGWARRLWAERRLEAVSRSLVGPTGGEDRAALLRRLGSLLEHRDPYTHGHSKRVARHAERIAGGMGLSREQIARVRSAALVHDIGKINVPRSVLTKPGRLTEAEFELVKRHPGDGAVMAAELGDPELAAIVRHHHERLDGRGYPDGLAGADIPLGARIIAVADTFDAITSARPYRKQRTHRQALDVVRQEAGTQLDADVVESFTGYYAARRSVGWAAVLLAAPQRLLSGLGGVQSGLAAGAAPLAQTACGVGAVALLGACLAGPAQPAPSGESAKRAEVASVATTAAPKTDAAPAAGRSVEPDDPQGRSGAGTGVDDRGSARRDGGSLRGLSAPDGGEAPGGGGSPQGSQPGGSGSGPGGGGAPPVPNVVPETPALPPDLPDPNEALDPVNDLLPPEVQVPSLPVPVPQLPVPVPPINVPQLNVPGLNVPKVTLPRLGQP